MSISSTGLQVVLHCQVTWENIFCILNASFSMVEYNVLNYGSGSTRADSLVPASGIWTYIYMSTIQVLLMMVNLSKICNDLNIPQELSLLRVLIYPYNKCHQLWYKFHITDSRITLWNVFWETQWICIDIQARLSLVVMTTRPTPAGVYQVTTLRREITAQIWPILIPS